MSPPPSDRAGRAAALDPTRSFIVQAPAGSGKTELLIQRYLALLATVEAPEEIIAITFTIKAAGEMRRRVLAALAAARTGAAPDDERHARTFDLARAVLGRDAAHGWRVAENPVRLRVQTIDALCASLTRQMPLLSRFGALPATVEDAAHLYREAARATLELVESNAEVANDVACILAHLDNDALRLLALIEAMLERRESFEHLARLDRAALEGALARERERVAARAAALYPGAAPSNAADFQALARELLTTADGWRKRSPQAQALSARDAADGLRRALADVKNLPPPRYEDGQWEVLSAIGNVLRYAIAQLELAFRAHNQVDFAAITQATLLALGEDGAPTDLALALDYRIRHLLVDELQDTSSMQYTLIARLTAGWQQGDGRTLFAVGDPMQSIYRFRAAEVGEFLRAWRTATIGSIRLQRVQLTMNFRSQAGIVHWVNDAFAAAMPLQEDASAGAVPHVPSTPCRSAEPGLAVAVHPFFDRDERGEAGQVVALVERIKQAERGDTVAILVRTRAHLRDIAPQLRAAGVRLRAVEIETLGERPVVQDLFALTRALSHLGDRLAWLAVLRAPWCGLTLADLAALAESDDAQTVWGCINSAERVAQLSVEGATRLGRARDALAPTIDGRLRGSLRDAVERVWLALGGPASVTDATDLQDADVYLDALEQAEEAGSLLDLAAFGERLAQLWAAPDAQAADDDVQLMTIHKAKGLEFDHVIVPGLGRAPRSDDQRLFLWMQRPGSAADGKPEVLVAPIAEAGSKLDPIYAWLEWLDAEREAYEATRLLYVAATRARRRLHLLGDVSLDAETRAPRAPGASTLLARLWPVVRKRFDAAAAAGLDRQANREPARPPVNQVLRRLAADWQLPAPPAAIAYPPLADTHSQEEIEFSWAGETARHVGSVAHRWLQRMADDALAGWDAERVEALRGVVRQDLAGRGVLDGVLERAADRVVEALRHALSDARGRWLLGPQRSAFTEYRLTALVDGVVRRLVIDRLFETPAGERWIVDYKTSAHEGTEVERFLDREQERYAAQLDRYARALGGATRRGLYFPLLAGWRES